jgi:hypothetical protein
MIHIDGESYAVRPDGVLVRFSRAKPTMVIEQVTGVELGFRIHAAMINGKPPRVDANHILPLSLVEEIERGSGLSVVVEHVDRTIYRATVEGAQGFDFLFHDPRTSC